MEQYIKAAVIALSLIGTPLIATEQENIQLITSLGANIQALDKGLELICIHGNKDGIATLEKLRANIVAQKLVDSQDPLKHTLYLFTKKVHDAFLKAATPFENPTSVESVIKELTNSADFKKLSVEISNELKKIIVLAKNNNQHELATHLEEILHKMQVGQTKWSKSPLSFLGKIAQSIRTYLNKK